MRSTTFAGLVVRGQAEPRWTQTAHSFTSLHLDIKLAAQRRPRSFFYKINMEMFTKKPVEHTLRIV